MLLGPTTKREFYRRFERGEFGNRGLMWPSIAAARKDGYLGMFGIRTKGVGTRCDYYVPNAELESRIASFRADGYADADINISAMMPDDKIVIQGEIQRGPGGLYLRYSTLPTAMRNALAQESQHATGVKVHILLRRSCDPSSYDWLLHLLDTYHIDHAYSSVVEFSTYSIPIGTDACLGKNTLIWEVRNY